MLRTLLGALLLLLSWASAAAAQTEPNRTYVDPRLTPRVERAPLPTALARPRVTSEVRVGERAPDFELEDTGGSRVKLSAMRGQWVALCFVGRREGVTALQRVQTELAPRGVRVVAVCAEKAHSLKRFVNEHPTSVLALADPMSDVACLYGLYDTTRDRSLPGLVLLDIEGRVRLAIMGQALPEEDVARIVQYAVAGF